MIGKTSLTYSRMCFAVLAYMASLPWAELGTVERKNPQHLKGVRVDTSTRARQLFHFVSYGVNKHLQFPPRTPGRTTTLDTRRQYYKITAVVFTYFRDRIGNIKIRNYCRHDLVWKIKPEINFVLALRNRMNKKKNVSSSAWQINIKIQHFRFSWSSWESESPSKSKSKQT